MNNQSQIIIDVIAPGFSFDQILTQKAKKILEKKGIELRIPKDLAGKDLLFANTDKQRVAHILKALKSKDSEFIWCVRGGSGSYRLLNALDKNLKSFKKKTIIGYSDITSLLNYFYEKKQWTSLHAPLLENIPNPGRAADILNIVNYIKGESLKGFRVSPLNKKAIQLKSIKGIAIGGNLSVLTSHVGTPFQIKPGKKSILFIEDTGERAYKVDKMLWQLEQAGVLKNIIAIVVGEFSGGHEKNGQNLLNRFFKQYSASSAIPIFKTNQFGHGKNKSPLLIGGQVEISKATSTSYQVQFGNT